MKVNRVIHTYAVKITDEPFTLLNGRVLESTARITYRDINKNIIERKKYGVIDLNDLYEKINNNESIDLSNCYINNFSSTHYRSRFKISKEKTIELKDFVANDSIFEADRIVDFSYCKFTGNEVNFSNSHFGNGNLSFYSSIFSNGNVDFSNTSYSEGNNSFQYTKFGNGDLSFENASFINGNLSFINTKFGNGNANFKNINFGNGDVMFSFSIFGKGSKSFDRCIFNGLYVDFSKVEFGSGKLDFRRVDFGNAEVNFQEIEHEGFEKVNFRRAKFGKRTINFEEALFGDVDVQFDEAEFGSGKLSLLNARAKSFSFSKCILSNYIDLRVYRCQNIDLSYSIIRDIVDLKPGIAPVKVKKLYLQGIRILGKIFISWDQNHVQQLISNQNDTDDFEKAEQFRVLKEDFRSSGNYNDEDKAYVFFKRYELKHLSSERLKRHSLNFIWNYPLNLFQKIVFDFLGLYATSPLRVLFSILIANMLYASFYLMSLLIGFGQISCINDQMNIIDKGLNSFYFSAITFFTIGYGECVPTGILKIISPIEGFTGVFLMSYFTVAFVRKILR